MEQLVKEGEAEMAELEKRNSNWSTMRESISISWTLDLAGVLDESFLHVLQRFGYLVIVIFVGSLFYRLVEGMPIGTGFYMGFITATTVGFGDATPVTLLGQLFGIVFIPACVGCAASLVAAFSHAFLKSGTPSVRKLRVAETLTKSKMKSLDLQN